MKGLEPGGRGVSLSLRQERIADWLLRQVGPGPAAFFRDACGLAAEDPPWASASHLVAHLLREVQGAVLSVLAPIGAESTPLARGHRDPAVDGHRTKIRVVLNELGIDYDDAIAELWLGLAGSGNQQGLASRAHRPALDVPRPFDDEVRDVIDTVEQVFDAVLERFETNYHTVFDRLDVLLATPDPSKNDARAVWQNFPRNHVVSHHFFSHASVTWLSPLRRAGFFRAPPPAQVDEKAGTVQIPSWPESEYLVRVATQAPDEVVEAVLGIPSTDNSRVYDDVVRVALAVPPVVSARLVAKVVEGLGSRFGLLSSHEVGALVVHLCDGGCVEEAMTLARALLGRAPTGYGPSATADVYEYSLILREHVPAIVDMIGVPALGLLCGLLAEVIRLDAEQHGRQPAQDGSALWRPNIDGYEHRAESDLRHALVNAIRDAAAAIVESDRSHLVEVTNELESHQWLIFRRVALHLLTRHVDIACDLVAVRLTDRVTINDRGLEREYLVLAGAGATCLDTQHLREVLLHIDAGPRPQVALGAPLVGVDRTAVEPMAPERVARWQRDRLAALHRVLPARWDARYQELVAVYGVAPDPAQPLPEPYAFWAGEEDGPVTSGELAAMPTAVLVDFLRSWQPSTNDRRGASQATLRGVLNRAVQDDATRRSTDAASFIGLPSAYVAAVINAFWQAFANKVALDWDSVIRLSTWINQQALDELANLPADDAPREWSIPRMDMLRLLAAGLDAKPCPIAASNDTPVWAIIESCCDDPDPTAAHEAERGPIEPEGYISLAHTTMRPEAIRAAVAFGLRLTRCTVDTDLTAVHTLLGRHLDRQREPSCSVRAVYGNSFRALSEWTSAGRVGMSRQSSRLILVRVPSSTPRGTLTSLLGDSMVTRGSCWRS